MWNDTWFVSDAELGMSAATPEGDLRIVANERSLDELEETRDAAHRDLLVQRTYQAPGGKGCVMFFLTGGRAHSKSTLLTLGFSEEAGLAARRLVRFFDYGLLDNAAIIRVLNELIIARRQANRLEDEAIERVRGAIALK